MAVAPDTFIPELFLTAQGTVFPGGITIPGTSVGPEGQAPREVQWVREEDGSVIAKIGAIYQPAPSTDVDLKIYTVGYDASTKLESRTNLGVSGSTSTLELRNKRTVGSLDSSRAEVTVQQQGYARDIILGEIDETDKFTSNLLLLATAQELKAYGPYLLTIGSLAPSTSSPWLTVATSPGVPAGTLQHLIIGGLQTDAGGAPQICSWGWRYLAPVWQVAVYNLTPGAASGNVWWRGFILTDN